MEPQPINAYRRNLLKLLVVGGGAFVVGKFASPFINYLNGDTVINEQTFQNFKVVETGRNLKILDKEGAEIFIVEKDSF